MNEKNLSDYQLVLPRYLWNAVRKNSFMSCVTVGERGLGKSTYHLKCMAQLAYQRLHYDDVRSWEYSLDNMIFTPDELIERVEQNLDGNHVDDVWCLDDATTHFNSYLFFLNVYRAALLKGMFDTLRTVVHALLINCPHEKGLFGALKQYDDYRVKIYTAKGGSYYDRRAICIKWNTSPAGDRMYFPVYRDHFSCHVPNWVYERYLEKKKQCQQSINEELKILQEKMVRKRKGLKRDMAMMKSEGVDDSAE